VIVGVVNTLFYMTGLYIFLEILKLPPTPAATLAYVFSVYFYYVAHRYFTFGSSAPIWPEICRLLPATLLNYIISLGLVIVLSRGLMLSTGWVAAISGAAAAGTGYLLASLWIFAGKPRGTARRFRG
jgi:putative flippase GtrA